MQRAGANDSPQVSQLAVRQRRGNLRRTRVRNLVVVETATHQQTKHTALHTKSTPYPPHRSAHKTTAAGNRRERTTHFREVSLLFGSAAAIFATPASEIWLRPRLRPNIKPKHIAFSYNHFSTQHATQRTNPPQQAARGGERLTSSPSPQCSAATQQLLGLRHHRWSCGPNCDNKQ